MRPLFVKLDSKFCGTAIKHSEQPLSAGQLAHIGLQSTDGIPTLPATYSTF